MNTTITVNELISILKHYPKDIPILIASDEEGNSFRVLQDTDLGVASFNGETNQYDIEVGIPELTEDLIQDGFSDEDVYDYKCLVLG